MNYVLIIGAKSDIAKELARVYAANGYALYLAARNSDELADQVQDLKVRSGQDAQALELDLTDFASHAEFWQQLNPKPVGVINVAGFMAEQKDCEQNWNLSLQTINANFTGAVSLLNLVANEFEQNKAGFIVGVSSVAGDRGRKANYIYGASKAGFSAYLSGLRNRLAEVGVPVLTVKPGFVSTKMTAGMDLPAKLTAEPAQVASHIFKAQQKGKDVIYSKPIWRLVMLIIKYIPERIFKKLSI